MAVWWVFLKVFTRRWVWDIVASRSAVTTRPSWMSSEFIARLHKCRREALFVALPVAIAGAALVPSSRLLRILAALLFSLYHVIETSSTSRHGVQYVVLHSMWAFVFPDPFGSAICYGACIHFILSTGLAKMLVGGRAWASSECMRVYLEAYGASSSVPPLSPTLNKWIRRQPAVTKMIAVVTLALELVIVPGTLLIPHAFRPIASAALLCMHLGITIVMSSFVGAVFITSFPAYIVGFSCRAPILSVPWCLATGVGLLPSLFVLVRGGQLVEENWPVSPCALFMWNGKQASQITRLAMGAEMRMVLFSRVNSPKQLLKIPFMSLTSNILQKGDMPSRSAHAYDALLRVVGYTLARGGIERAFGDSPWDEQKLVDAIASWLESERRLIELESRKHCDGCALVRISKDKITDVIAFASASAGKKKVM